MIVGCGSLTRAICDALAVIASQPHQVAVVSRTAANVGEACYVAGVRAAAGGTGARFEAVAVTGYSADSLAPIIARRRPDILLNCASRHSPWEVLRAPSAWTSLLRRAGFGFTLPLQSAVAIEVAAAHRAAGAEGLLVNACFPDAVNVVLERLGYRVFCGVGNVAILDASLRAGLGLGRDEPLQILGHHWHLHSPDDPADDARAWHRGVLLTSMTELLGQQRRTARLASNSITGHVTARLLDDLLAGRTVQTNLPGPAGLLGGYPVHIGRGQIRLALPTGVSTAEATHLNWHWAELDGATVSVDGQVSIGQPSTEPGAIGVPAHFHVNEIVEVAARMVEFRARLRQRPETARSG